MKEVNDLEKQDQAVYKWSDSTTVDNSDYCTSGYVYVEEPGKLYPMTSVPAMPEAPKKEVKDMMGLYEVYVVDTKKGKVIIHNEIVAKDEDKAKIRVAMGYSTDIPDNIEFFVRCIGQWEDKKPKEVKIVKE